MKDIKFLIIGVLVGILLSTSFVFAEPIKQFILTQSNVPLLINGKEYTPKSPILNYNGTTYVPLKELGEIVGVKVEWNDKEKHIEIGESNINVLQEQREYISVRELRNLFKLSNQNESAIIGAFKNGNRYLSYNGKEMVIFKDEYIEFVNIDDVYLDVKKLYDRLIDVFGEETIDKLPKYKF